MSGLNQKLLRIAVFYDGGFFTKVSDFYRYSHARKRPLSISGIHEFIRYRAAELEEFDPLHSQIVDSHFFRGRFSAERTQMHKNKLFTERSFDDVLMAEGVTTHYLPIPGKVEKGIDVWLSLEAFELAIYKRCDVLALITGDSDFIPLVRKVNSLGCRVMVLSWNLEDTDDSGVDKSIIASPRLLREAAHPVMMQQIIGDKANHKEPLINGLFYEASAYSPQEDTPAPEASPAQELQKPDVTYPSWAAGNRIKGVILSLKENGFGFIKCPDFNDHVFFHHSSLINQEFGYLQEGNAVSFLVEQGSKGPVAREVEVMEEVHNIGNRMEV